MYLTTKELEYIKYCINHTQNDKGCNEFENGLRERVEEEIQYLNSGNEHILYE